ncbi:MAG: hypothetical protein IKQ10_04935 [Oscillospiraceae bacterium]|nr:hypothetical protein [Oscillospiraceae bacterium]
MKNQYVGDVGDYGKYGLLRFLTLHGIKLGVNWYLTPDDYRTDGNHREYLYDPRLRTYDEKLYDVLSELAFRFDKTIQMVQNAGVMDDADFYDELIDLQFIPWRERAEARMTWHQKALETLGASELVFADPDNGLSSTQKPSLKDAQKYILPNEVIDYFERGQQVLYYHHRPRKKGPAWYQEKTQIKQFLPDARLLALSFNRWGCRTYVFVLHEDRYRVYQEVIDEFMDSPWGKYRVDRKAAFIREKV